MKFEMDKELLEMEEELEEPMGDDLDAFQEERRQERLAQARRKRATMMGVGVIAVLGVVAVLLNQEDIPEDLPEDLSGEWAHVAPFAEVHALDGGLIAVLPSRWDGDAEAACGAMLTESGVGAGNTVTLLNGDGLVVAECGD